MSESVVEQSLRDYADAALGRHEREDAVLPRTGGPAGNALLTAWLGLALLVLFAMEGLTLLDVHGFISWHVAIGAILVPPVLAKTATTGWRIFRYYSGRREYVAAGPPPLVLRLSGPLVVLSTLLLLGTGIALVLIGQDTSRQTLLDVLGLRVDWVWLHQASFAVWFAMMTVHVLARTLPAWRLATARRAVPGLSLRVVALVLSGALAVGAAVWLVGAEGSWGQDFRAHYYPGYGETGLH